MPPDPVHSPIRHADTLAEGQRITLDASHARALRFREINPKEAFTLADAGGRFFRASLTSLHEGGGEALVYEAMKQSPESPARITLFCAVLARQRMLTVVQKATELGVSCVVPVLSARSVPREGLAHEKAHAWPGQALRASRQCRRASVPEVRRATPLAEALDDVAFRGARGRFFLDDQTGRPSTIEPGASGIVELALAVGPEGGWTDEERRLLADRGALPLRLGGRVLRAETAVLVGLTVLQQAYGDM